MSRPDDPYGKRALFSSPPDTTSDAPEGGDAGSGADQPDPAGGERAVGEGRRALFSSTDPVTHDEGRHARLECSSCRESRDLGPMALVRRMFPSLWVPGLRWPVYMRCPACTEMAWCAIDVRPLLRR